MKLVTKNGSVIWKTDPGINVTEVRQMFDYLRTKGTSLLEHTDVVGYFDGPCNALEWFEEMKDIHAGW